MVLMFFDRTQRIGLPLMFLNEKPSDFTIAELYSIYVVQFTYQ